jgi:hypothetical protein
MFSAFFSPLSFSFFFHFSAPPSLFVLQILFAENGAKTERQSLFVFAFDNLKKT